ncbi:MAG TPA: M23 family metallopeptidase, partial [Candidatus Polarisedimenticolia bacterium]|nr:M23 family metallopeptidase [Candidatus Polarisedimenticolia bacterium]
MRALRRHRHLSPALIVLAAGAFSWVTAAGPAPHRAVDSGGGVKVFDEADDLTDQQRKEIQQQIDLNIEMLRAEGKLPSLALSSTPVLLSWPLRQSNGLHVFDTSFIQNFVDLDPAVSNHLLDHNCLTRTYDTAFYNHGGTDITLWPFAWLWMDNSQVEIVAAAPGTIIYKVDGYPDRSCSTSTAQWNAVYIQNDDGNVVLYGHMKRLSTTTKALGERVERGEYLGVVGSAGNSTSPHLHMEVHSPLGAVIDPYSGPCNPIPSLWEDQRPYYDSKINVLMTGTASSEFPTCSQEEIPHARIDFNPGDTIYFSSFWQDRLGNQVTDYKIYEPDGSIWTSWSYSASAPYVGTSWFWWAYDFTGAPTGIWKFEATYEGRVYEHYFSIGGPFPVGGVPLGGTPGTPLTVQRLPGGDLTLSWGVSCMTSETDWEVYEGSLGHFYSHQPKQCSTGGQTSAVITPAAGDSYYLVVARNAGWEGSYGTNSAGMEIPPPETSCLVQNIGVCDLCGDDMITPPEPCDGANLAGQTCLSLNFDGGSLACNASCTAFDTSGCTTVCGDMIHRGNEPCDGPDLGGQTCQSQLIGSGTLACNATC